MGLVCIYGTRECDGCGWCFNEDEEKHHDGIKGYRQIKNDDALFVPVEDALAYALARCGLRFDFGEDYSELDGEQCRKMIEDWYFGSDWLICYDE